MIPIIKNSIFYKLGENLCKKSVLYYKQSAIFNFFETLKKSYTFSITKKCTDKSLNTKTHVYTSFYAKITNVFRTILIYFGDLYDFSFINKAFNNISSSYKKISSKSKILSLISKITLKDILLVSLALYLPIDYTLRTILQIPVLPSIWDEALLFVSVIVIITRIATRKNEIKTSVTPLDPYMILYLIVGLFLMFTINPYMSIAIAGYRAVFQYMLFFFVATNIVENQRDYKIIFNTLIGLIVLIGFHGIVQYILAVPIPETWVTQTEESVRTRVFSILGSPNIMGSILVLLTPMLASYVYTSRSIFIKILALGTTGIMALSVIFTFSKGAWIGMALAVLIFAILVDRKLIALMLAGIAGIIVLVPSVVTRITYLFTLDYAVASEAGGRSMRWKYGLELLEKYGSTLGVGLGRFGGAVAMENQISPSEFDYFYLDNYYLKTMVETGYLGLIFYVLLLVMFVVFSIKALNNLKNTSLYIPNVALFSGMCGVLIHCYFENIFEVPYMTAYFWIMAGMIMSSGFNFNKNKIN